ncbi:hypothetical protein GCM10028833_11680 [Glycomyces tarimensis]
MPHSPRILEANVPPQLGFVTPFMRPGLHSSSRGFGRGRRVGCGRAPGSVACCRSAAVRIGAWSSAGIGFRFPFGHGFPLGRLVWHWFSRRQSLGQFAGRFGPVSRRVAAVGQVLVVVVISFAFLMVVFSVWSGSDGDGVGDDAEDHRSDAGYDEGRQEAEA